MPQESVLAIANGTPLPEGAEILTKEAYSDLCLRASKADGCGMTREDMYLLGCLFAVNRMIENGSSSYGIKVNGKWETISWDEIKAWIEKQYAIVQEDAE